MPWLRKYRLRADEDVGTMSNFNRKSTDSRSSSVSKSLHENTVARLRGEIEFLKCELEKAKIQLLMTETATKDDRDMPSRNNAEDETRGPDVADTGTEHTGSDSESSSASKQSAGKLQLPDTVKKDRDDSTNETPFEVYE